MKRLLAPTVIAMAILSTTTLSGCKKTPEEEKRPPVPVESISIDQTSLSIEIDDTFQLSATVLPTNADNTSVTWKSGAPYVATVDAKSGVVTAVNYGEAGIFATSADGNIFDKCVVRVPRPPVPVESVSIDKEKLTLLLQSSSQLVATVLPKNADNRSVKWSSDNTSVATVNADSGLVNGVAAGEATITVTTVNGGKTDKCVVTVTSSPYYTSTDYSRDKDVVTMQTATEGKGINIVLMGDGFSDRLIADGTYDELMRENMEIFFSIEPYTSFRDYFTVKYIIAVSKNELFIQGATETALHCRLASGNNTLIDTSDDNATAIAYANQVVDNLDNTAVVVLVNNKSWHGTCHYPLWPPGWPNNPKDWGEGFAIGYYTLGRYTGEMGQVLIHETNGHAFAKLADEYVNYSATIPNNEKENTKRMAPFGWDKNIDFTNDPAEIKWAKFLSDSRYNGQGLGVYEGGNYYAKGVWRPTYDGMMNSARGEFNAPSREAIYYRIHKLAYGAAWQYDHEAFVEWDLAHYGKSTRTAQAPPAGFGVLSPRPHTSPVFGGAWDK